MTGKRKRTNKNRIPLSADSINEERIIGEASVGNMYYAWLLVIPTLMEQESVSRERIQELWDIANDYIEYPQTIGSNVGAVTKEIEAIIGLPVPYPMIDFSKVRTEGDLDALKRKLKKNALHAALCIIALAMKSTKLYSSEDLRRIFFNVDLTMAEISSGATSYERLLETVRSYGIELSEGADDMGLATCEG